MQMNKIFFLLSISFVSLVQAKCNRLDRTHANANVLRCTYHQEDIYRCYSEKSNCYKNEQKRNECFFCGCPIEEHTKLNESKQKKTIKKKK